MKHANKMHTYNSKRTRVMLFQIFPVFTAELYFYWISVVFSGLVVEFIQQATLNIHAGADDDAIFSSKTYFSSV